MPDHPGDPVADETTWTDAVDQPWTETDDATPVEDEPEEAPEEPEPVAEVASVATARQGSEEQAQGWAAFGRARTAEEVLERSDRNPTLDVLPGEDATAALGHRGLRRLRPRPEWSGSSADWVAPTGEHRDAHPVEGGALCRTAVVQGPPGRIEREDHPSR